jgi:eukaryotic-like serine/threonine-protein kinase
MGVVYEAEHTETRKRIALKLISLERRDDDLPPELQRTTTSDDSLVRFQREARAAGSIDTPHVVQVFDAGTDDDSGRPYLAMELLRGESLDTLLDRTGPLEPGVAVRIAAQACKGLVHAHAAGVVHRDIKPGNLFLARDDGGGVVVKLLDFGIAKIAEGAVISSGARDLTTTGSLLGSPRYMAPEQVKGLRTVDHRADLWALGVVLYRMLAGRTPHGADAPGELLLAVCTQRPDPLQEHAPWIDPALARVVDGALQISVSRRYPDAASMLAALTAIAGDEVLGEDDLLPIPAAARARIAPRIDLRAADDERTLRDRPSGSPRRRALYVLGGALVAAGVFVGWRAAGSAEVGPEPVPAPPAAPPRAAVAATAVGAAPVAASVSAETAVAPPASSPRARPAVKTAPSDTAARTSPSPRPPSTAQPDELDVTTSLE